jgi:hypothetical protein
VAGQFGRVVPVHLDGFLARAPAANREGPEELQGCLAEFLFLACPDVVDFLSRRIEAREAGQQEV